MPVTSLNRRILIIDDNRQIHGDFAKILGAVPTTDDALADAEAALFGKSEKTVGGRLEFVLRSAYQGQEGALEIEAALARGEPYALAFVDMRMPPGWDGLQTISRIWDVDPDVQIVLCTAFSDYSWSDITAKMGYSDRLLILKKPFDTVEVLQLAHALSEKWAMAQTLKQHVAGLGILVDERTRELQLANASLGLEIVHHQATISELAAARRRGDQVLRAVPMVLIGVDAEGMVTHWNAIAEATLGLPRAQAVGMALASLPVAWTPESALSLVAQARADGHAAEIEVKVGRAGQPDAFLALSAAPITESGSEILVFGSDVTKRKLIESHLMDGQKLEAIGQLAAGIAHEINTPTQYIGDNARFLQDSFKEIDRLLAAYRAFASAMRTGGDLSTQLQAVDAVEVATDIAFLASEIPKSLEQSIQGLDQIAKIVAAMRDFSRQDHGTRSVADINDSLRSTADVARSEYKYVADVILELDPQLPKITCCVSEINQVFLNILVNAAQSIRSAGLKSRGTIRISTSKVADTVVIAMTDDGPGIPSSIRMRIGEPFFTTKPVGKDTGQGLYLSRNIVVNGHGGTLEFVSVEGGPTTFTVVLPIAAKHAAAPAAQ